MPRWRGGAWGAVVAVSGPANPYALPTTLMLGMSEAGDVAMERLMQLRPQMTAPQAPPRQRGTGGPRSTAVAQSVASQRRKAFGAELNGPTFALRTTPGSTVTRTFVFVVPVGGRGAGPPMPRIDSKMRSDSYRSWKDPLRIRSAVAPEASSATGAAEPFTRLAASNTPTRVEAVTIV
ncbi:MAG: hypothetical protein ACKOFI_07905 [Phycisphaerales bacterium]